MKDLAGKEWRRWTAWLDETPSYDEVRLVRLDHGDGDLSASRQVLSEAESEHASGIKAAQAMRQFVTTRAVLRTLLGMICRQNPKAVPIGSGEHGKPKVLGEGDAGGVRFNLSHGHGTSVLAFATGREVGIDIEAIKAETDVMGISRRFFRDAETQFLATLEDQGACREAFHMLWTQREALAKAHGRGLTDDVFEPPLLPLRHEQVVSLDERDWRLSCPALVPRHAVALAVEGETEVRLSYWEAPDLDGSDHEP